MTFVLAYGPATWRFFWICYARSTKLYDELGVNSLLLIFRVLKTLSLLQLAVIFGLLKIIITYLIPYCLNRL